jgi:membrane-associated phospholipid phosphatase
MVTSSPLPSQHPTLAGERKAEAVSGNWRWISGLGAIGLVVVLGIVVTIRGASTFEADAEWMEEILEHRSPVWEVPSLVMDFVGGGWFGVFVVPIVTVLALLLARRRWAALYYAVSASVSVGIVQVLKNVFGRARPEQILIESDFGSFPSGHVANAATIAVTLGILFPRLWVWAAGAAYVALMLLSRTYLGAHWFTDTIGGLVLGAAVALIVWAPFAYRLVQERKAAKR